MKVLFIVSSHNGLSQRAWTELVDKGHDVSIQLASSDKAIEDAVFKFNPDLIIAPFLKTAIPDSIWKHHTCLIVHPGIKGDRGAHSLDWALMTEQEEWGVTVLQAAEEMDAGDIWATRNFPMRSVSKSCLYRHEVTQAAIEGILEAVDKFESGKFVPEKLDYSDPAVKGKWNDPIRRKDRTIDWRMSSREIIKRIRAADSNPGVLEENIFPFPCYMFGAHMEEKLSGSPGELIAQRDKAICIGTGDGAIWVSHLKRVGHFKLPALTVLEGLASQLPISTLDLLNDDLSIETFREIWYEEKGNVGYLHFDFYNGAMSADQIQRLRSAFFQAKTRSTDITVLMGGHDIWSNGIHLNVIENAAHSAEESWNNIVAMDDFVRDVMTTHTHYIVSAIHGNAGAGGVILALAADLVLAREGVILNPHYKKMGLFGSEYWTYLLPKRVGQDMAGQLTSECQPINTRRAKQIGLIDDAYGANIEEFRTFLESKIAEIKATVDFASYKAEKRRLALQEEARVSLDTYRDHELGQMWGNFYDVESKYHALRYFFVNKVSCAIQPADYRLENFKLVPISVEHGLPGKVMPTPNKKIEKGGPKSKPLRASLRGSAIPAA